MLLWLAIERKIWRVNSRLSVIWMLGVFIRLVPCLEEVDGRIIFEGQRFQVALLAYDQVPRK